MSDRRIAAHPDPLALAAELPQMLPDARIRYGASSPVQFADLRLPKAAAPPSGFPVAIFIHGGGWTADWTKDYASPFVETLTNCGFATWDLEFRRLGNAGGGYPGTFLDIASAADKLREVSESYLLDMNRIIAIGHSTGGHLALWLAGRVNLKAQSPLFTASPLPIKGVISLGGVNDLAVSLDIGDRRDVLTLLGVSSPAEAEQLFHDTSPPSLLPFGIPQILIAGTLEDQWRKDMTKIYAEKAIKSGDVVEVFAPENIDHFDLVDPRGPMVDLILSRAKSLV